jgi:hypothetical protein
MANRRKFLAGLGALASGSAAAVGTGAFSSVSAERGVSVSVVGDGDAYLRMVPESQYASFASNGEIKLTFDSLNTDATSEFSDVFAIQNQGDQNAAIWLDTGDASAAVYTEEGESQGTIAPNIEDNVEDRQDKDISFGVVSDAGPQLNGATAAPSNYVGPSGNGVDDKVRGFTTDNPYVLTPGDVIRPDMYFITDDNDAGKNITGTLRVLGFTEEYVD